MLEYKVVERHERNVLAVLDVKIGVVAPLEPILGVDISLSLEQALLPVRTPPEKGLAAKSRKLRGYLITHSYITYLILCYGQIQVGNVGKLSF
jgi:hypothetical protein